MTNNGSKLGLGGHSFIGALGNDPAADFDEQCAIVNTCLDSGIEWFDTTYFQERVALGEVLRSTGRRHEAKIIAWNFFRPAGNPDDLAPFTPYRASHIDEILLDLQTDYVDLLVIHSHNNLEQFQSEIELVSGWIADGKVLRLGLGMAEYKHLDMVSDKSNGFSAILAPYNAFHQSARDLFSEASTRSIDTFAMSPFIRGWKLSQSGQDTSIVADHLLRWSSSQVIVDHVLVSMRNSAWVEANLKSERRGELNQNEAASVSEWIQASAE